MYQTLAQRPYSTPASNSVLLPLLLLSLARQKHSPSTARTIKKEYDYVVVGAGSAGSVVANRLSEIPCINVLLIEAGSSPPELTDVPAFARESWYTKYDWAYLTKPQAYTGNGLVNRQVVYPRGKMLGGCSTMNHMMYVRGNRHNYDNWSKLGAKGWSYQEVLPYFKKLEDNRDPDIVANGYHNVGGPITAMRPDYTTETKPPMLQSAENVGYQSVDSNGPVQTGLYDHQGNVRDNQRCGTAKAYLVPAENRTNLDILPNAMVTKVIIENRRAVGVQFDFSGSSYVVLARKEVILSAGSLNSAQLLMLSGVGPKEELSKFNIPVIADLPVGRNLQDHAGPNLDFVVNLPIQTSSEKQKNDMNIMEYINSRSGPLASCDGEIMQLFLPSTYVPPGEDNPDYQSHFSETTTDTAKKYFGLTPEVYNQVYRPYEGKPLVSCYTCMIQPKSRGTVTLQSANPYDAPIVDPNYFSDPQDLDVVVQAMLTCKRVGTSPPLSKYISRIQTLFPGCEQFAGNDPLYFRCQAQSVITSIFHPVGTAKMGDPSDPTTVVDPELRVKGIDGLRVVDASVMPTVTSGNTNIPIIMIGEKASDIIKQSIVCAMNMIKSSAKRRHLLPGIDLIN
ncbi:glucose dehydrogenase [FAD, quinone]-like [Uloborus diversus]|uniref:glucose dehydrogenase [FAD, quinone]-like n=1 Tax=Uloborus diversus TaxID=327109 RepID=UPI00240A257F|nr:glucose dehydrogenase [FAD, quinone]-like [Uloborus diversus]